MMNPVGTLSHQIGSPVNEVPPSTMLALYNGNGLLSEWHHHPAETTGASNGSCTGSVPNPMFLEDEERYVKGAF